MYKIAKVKKICHVVVESTTTRTAGGLDFTAIGGKRQGREVPQSLRVEPGAKHPVWKTQSIRNGFDITSKSVGRFFQKAEPDICKAFRERNKEAALWEKIRILNSIKTKIAALDIVRELPNGQSMRDLMRMTNPVMMAEPEEFAETEKGKNLVQSEVSTNAILYLNHDTPWPLLQLVDFCSKDKVALRWPPKRPV